MRKPRYLAPVGVVAAIAVGTGVTHLASASAAPKLAPISAAQLIAKAQQSHVDGLVGTVRWSADLGLPSISALTGGAGQGIPSGSFAPASLLSGSHDISVWDAGTDHQRLAIAGSLTETDVVHTGRDVYTYDSSTQHVTHYVLPARQPGDRPGTDGATTPSLTPDQVASRLLDQLTPGTAVSVASPVHVAGRAAYQLALAPRDTESTVATATIAVDAATGVPLRVQVTPRGSTTPALSIGYVGSLQLSAPPASAFAAPHGTTTTTKVIGAGDPGGAGTDPGGVDGAARPTTTGTGWGTVVSFALPSTQATPSTPAGGHRRSSSVGGTLAGLRRAGTTVTGSFGTASLVRSNLLNALVLPDGRVVAGFVTPAALEAAASHAAASQAAG